MRFTTLLSKLSSTTFLLFFLLLSKSGNSCNANFTHTNACAGDTVWFYAADQYAVYTWDFGDSTSQVNINHDTTTFHVYNTPGVYHVTLFVNVGAEFDYQTNVITIGNNCFQSDFSYICGGGGYIYFTNQSISSLSLLWNFGDTASGVNNTSVLSSPYHVYSNTGSYTVTLIASNGTVSDTSSQIVSVNSNCIGATIYPNIWGNCFNDSTLFNVGYSGTITSYQWNFDDPATGINNTSSLAQPKHLFSSTGNYNVELIISNGLLVDTIYKIIYVVDCGCWPGDCNDDGEVNAEDIFPIGMFYNNHGPERPAANNNFVSQPVSDWPNYTSWMYLQKFSNAKIADCNGDSTINNLDLAVVNLNYGMHHTNHNNRSSMPEATVQDPTMYIQFSSSSANAGSTISATIYLGTSSIPANNLYGYSFSILYDPAFVVPGSAFINLSSNWLGNSTNELGISNDNLNGKIDAAVVKYDKVQTLTGYGAIGTITFQLLNGVSGLFHLGIDATAKMLSTTMYSSTVSGNQEVFHPFNIQGADLTVLNSVGVTNNKMDDDIIIFPNPTNDMVHVHLNSNEVIELTVRDFLGRSVYRTVGSFTKEISLSTSGFESGIYNIELKTTNGTFKKVISVIH